LAGCVWHIGALLLEQSDEWATQRPRYMTLETATAVSDTLLPSACQLWLPDAVAQPAEEHRSYTTLWDTTVAAARAIGQTLQRIDMDWHDLAALVSGEGKR
jgi:hypothetical protein